MRASRVSLVVVLLSGLLGAAVSAPAQAAEPDVGTQRDGTVTYSDPALAGEETTTVEGTLRVVVVDRAGGGEYRYSVETEDGDTVPVEVADELPTSVADGAIAAEVVDAGSSAPQLAEATVEPAAIAAAPAARPHAAYVVRVTGTGTLPTAAAAKARITSAALDEWRIESGGAISDFGVERTADLSSSSCGFTRDGSSALWEAGAMKFPSVSFSGSSGNHLIMLVSDATCDDEGLGIGTVGSSIASGGMTTVLWSGTADGGADAITDATAVHELGHNFGLGHANLRACDACAENEYLDVYSVMGFGVPGSQPQALDTIYRDRLGITRPGEVVSAVLPAGDVEQQRSVSLVARGADDATQAVRVVDPISGRVLWVEYRDGAGRDTGSAYSSSVRLRGSDYRFAPGVTITEESKEAGSDGDIELVPHGGSGALDVGGTFASASGGVRVTVGAIDAGVATVGVTLRSGTAGIATAGAAGRARVDATATAVESGWPAGTTFTRSWTLGGQVVSTLDSYRPSASARGRGLVLTVVGTPPGGAPIVRASAPVTVGYGVFTTTPTPRITGTFKARRTVKAVPGSWAPTATLTYSWWYKTTALKGWSSSRSFTIPSKYVGKKIRVKVRATRAGYPTSYRYSAYTPTIKK